MYECSRPCSLIWFGNTWLCQHPILNFPWGYSCLCVCDGLTCPFILSVFPGACPLCACVCVWENKMDTLWIQMYTSIWVTYDSEAGSWCTLHYLSAEAKTGQISLNGNFPYKGHGASPNLRSASGEETLVSSVVCSSARRSGHIPKLPAFQNTSTYRLFPLPFWCCVLQQTSVKGMTVAADEN